MENCGQSWWQSGEDGSETQEDPTPGVPGSLQGPLYAKLPWISRGQRKHPVLPQQGGSMGNQMTSGSGPDKSDPQGPIPLSSLHSAGPRRARTFSKGTREPLGLIRVC